MSLETSIGSGRGASEAATPAAAARDVRPASVRRSLARLRKAAGDAGTARDRHACMLALRAREHAPTPARRKADGPRGPSAIAPSRHSPAFELDAFYSHAEAECRVSIRTGEHDALSLLFVSRDARAPRDAAGLAIGRVTHISLRPEISERPQNLAHQVLRTLFAQGDPFRHAPDAPARRRVYEDLLLWAARYLVFRTRPRPTPDVHERAPSARKSTL